MIKTIMIGDIEFVLRFKLGILKHISQLSGKDALVYIQEAKTDLFEYASVILNAGLRCQCDATGKEYPDRDAIDKQISANADISDIEKITAFMTEALGVKGEETAQANP